MMFDETRRQARTLLDECNALVEKAAGEKRGFTDDEKKTLGEKRAEAQKLLEDAEAAEAVYRMSQGLPGPAPIAAPSPAAPAAKPAFRSLGEFLPHIPLLPTGGIDLETLPAYAQAGAAGFGVGSPLFRRAQVEAGDWAGIEARCRAFRELCLAHPPSPRQRLSPESRYPTP